MRSRQYTKLELIIAALILSKVNVFTTSLFSFATGILSYSMEIFARSVQEVHISQCWLLPPQVAQDNNINTLLTLSILYWFFVCVPLHRSQCFKSAWMSAVLHDGLAFPVSYDKLRSASTVNKRSVQWTLGAILYRTRFFPLRFVSLAW